MQQSNSQEEQLPFHGKQHCQKCISFSLSIGNFSIREEFAPQCNGVHPFQAELNVLECKQEVLSTVKMAEKSTKFFNAFQDSGTIITKHIIMCQTTFFFLTENASKTFSAHLCVQ